jgi:uncharacterized integral membrane protein
MEQIDIWRKRTLTKADEPTENIKKKTWLCFWYINISVLLFIFHFGASQANSDTAVYSYFESGTSFPLHLVYITSD